MKNQHKTKQFSDQQMYFIGSGLIARWEDRFIDTKQLEDALRKLGFDVQDVVIPDIKLLDEVTSPTTSTTLH